MSVDPVIIIPGFGQSKLIVADDDGKKIKNAWPFEIDEKALLDDMKGSLMKMMLFRTDGGFSDKVANVVEDVTEPFETDGGGAPMHNIQVVSFDGSYDEYTDEMKNAVEKAFPVKKLAEKAGGDKIFFFAYNFLGDINENAEKLNAFVSSVKEKTGCNKVNFVVISTAGALLKVYLNKYGVNCSKAVNISAMLNGTPIISDIYENRWNLSDPASLLSSLGGKAASLSSVVGMLPPEVIDNIIKKSLAVVKKNILDNNTSVKSLIPSDGAFKFKAKELAENGTQFYQICGCGLKLPSVFESSDVCSDGVVDTASASFDGLFPETTWYFDGLGHLKIRSNETAMDIAVKILAGEDVSSFPKKQTVTESDN